MHETKKHAAVVDRLKRWAKAAALGNSLLAVALVYPCVTGIAEAAACPAFALGNLPAFIALGAGSCTLPDGSTLSNFRYSTSTVGGATVPPTSATYVQAASGGSLSVAQNSFFSGTPPGTGNSLTFNFGYKLTAAAGTVFNAVSEEISAYGGNSVDLETASASFCIGGTFSSIPPGSCSGGTLLTLPTLSQNNTSGFPTSMTFTPASSVDVFSSSTANGSVTLVGATQRFGTAVVPPPPPPPPGVPVPPSIILTLTGIGAAGLYMMRRRLAARS